MKPGIAVSRSEIGTVTVCTTVTKLPMRRVGGWEENPVKNASQPKAGAYHGM
jgi:hypothetical protein